MKKVRFFQDVMGSNMSTDIGPSDVTLVLLTNGATIWIVDRC